MINRTLNIKDYNINNLREIIVFYSFFILAILTTYLLSNSFLVLLQIVMVILFYFSKNNYFWFALVFIIESNPGGLFSTLDSKYTFSILNETGTGSLYFWMLFIISALIKSLFSKTKATKLFIIAPVFILILFYVFLIMTFGIYKLPPIIRLSLPWLLLFILPRLMPKLDDYVRFFNLIFYAVFIAFILQVVNIISGKNIAEHLGGPFSYFTELTLRSGDELLRPTDGIIIPFIAILGVSFFLTFKEKVFNKNYLYLVIGFAFASILLTATRGWILASFFILAALIILSYSRRIKTILGFAFPAIIILLIFSFIPFLQNQIESSITRFETIALIAQGDITAGGTLGRLSSRAPRVMSKFQDNPFFGFGYGKEVMEYSDGHVGNHNLLLHTGIVGYSLFLFLWLYFILKLYERGKNLSAKNKYKSFHIPLIVFLLGILIIHSTSTQIFNFLFTFATGFMVFFFFSFANFVYWDALSEEKK